MILTIRSLKYMLKAFPTFLFSSMKMSAEAYSSPFWTSSTKTHFQGFPIQPTKILKIWEKKSDRKSKEQRDFRIEIKSWPTDPKGWQKDLKTTLQSQMNLSVRVSSSWKPTKPWRIVDVSQPTHQSDPKDEEWGAYEFESWPIQNFT